MPSMSLAWVSIGRSAQVLVAAAADGVEAFQREAEGVDPLVADGALGDRCVCFSTSCRTVRPSVAASSSGSCGTSFGGLRQLLAEQDFAHPVAAQDRAGARRARLLGQRRRQAQDAAAADTA